jgi:SAM-dependent methyltransferase
MNSTHPTQRFSPRVEYYLRSRPKYPTALLNFFQTDLHLTPTHTIADIGSGTGFLTELFLPNGNPIYAIEPNPDMRSAAETNLKQFPNFHSIDATAEATTLPSTSIDFIIAGQAFHWFDPIPTRKEFLRILNAAGTVALIWNERRLPNSPFAQAYDELIKQFQTDPEVVKARSIVGTDQTRLGAFFAPAPCHQRTFDNPQHLNRQTLFDRIFSSSYMPLPASPRHAELTQAINKLFDAHQNNGIVTMPHDTEIYYGQLK